MGVIDRLTFLVVHNLALVVLLHFLGSDPSISDLAGHVRITFALVGDGPKEGRASSAWAAEDQAHLSRLECPRAPMVS